MTDDDSWRSVFYHPKFECTLMVYVDDFKMAGPNNHKTTKAWESICSVVDMDPPEELGTCLGIKHVVKHVKTKEGKLVRQMEWDMSGFLQQCIDLYLSKVPNAKLRKVASPFLTQVNKHDTIGEDDSSPPGVLGKVALQILMKILYCARGARFDLLKPVQGLANKALSLIHI